MVFEAFVLPFNRNRRIIRLACFADLHIGSISFARKKWHGWRDRHLQDPDTYFMGIGDMAEAIGPFDPRFTLCDIDPSMWKQALIDAQVRDLYQELEPIAKAGKLLGISMGNHEYTVLQRGGTDITARLCESLGVKNLGFSCLLHLTLRPEQASGHHGGGRTVKLYAHHGWGGGSRTKGGDITKVSRKPSEFVSDIFVFAHSHQGWEMPNNRLDITSSGKVFDRDYLMVNTGTFKKGLTEGPIPSYEEKSGYGPQKLGGRLIEIEVDTHKWVNLRTVE